MQYAIYILILRKRKILCQ